MVAKELPRPVGLCCQKCEPSHLAFYCVLGSKLRLPCLRSKVFTPSHFLFGCQLSTSCLGCQLDFLQCYLGPSSQQNSVRTRESECSCNISNYSSSPLPSSMFFFQVHLGPKRVISQDPRWLCSFLTTELIISPRVVIKASDKTIREVGFILALGSEILQGKHGSVRMQPKLAHMAAHRTVVRLGLGRSRHHLQRPAPVISPTGQSQLKGFRTFKIAFKNVGWLQVETVTTTLKCKERSIKVWLNHREEVWLNHRDQNSTASQQLLEDYS